MTETTGDDRKYTSEEMREACRNNYNMAIERAADVCAQAAVRLYSNGKARVNAVDRHTAEVLRSMELKILALQEQS